MPDLNQDDLNALVKELRDTVESKTADSDMAKRNLA